MILNKDIQQYSERNNIDIAFIIVLFGIVMSTFFEYAWVVSILACPFIKDEKLKENK